MAESSMHTFGTAGHVYGYSFKRLERLVAQRGCRLVRRPSSRVDTLVICSSAASRLLGEDGILVPSVVRDDAELISESDFLRLLGLRPAREPAGDIDAESLASLADVDVEALRVMRLFDLLEGGPEHFGYRDLGAARQVAELWSGGVPFEVIVEAAAQLRRRGLTLSEAKLAETPWGGLRRAISGSLATLAGQLEMEGADDGPSVEELLEAAEEAEDAGDLPHAIRSYESALRAEPFNPATCYSLATVLAEAGREREARIWMRVVVGRDPSFAEAWFGLGYMAEQAGDETEAARSYRRAIQAAPDFRDALFNLALILTKSEQYAEAKPLWERYLELEPATPGNHASRRALTLCRLSLRSWPAVVGGSPAVPRER